MALECPFPTLPIPSLVMPCRYKEACIIGSDCGTWHAGPGFLGEQCRGIAAALQLQQNRELTCLPTFPPRPRRDIPTGKIARSEAEQKVSMQGRDSLASSAEASRRLEGTASASGHPGVPVKVQVHKKPLKELSELYLVQEIHAHQGLILQDPLRYFICRIIQHRTDLKSTVMVSTFQKDSNQ